MTALTVSPSTSGRLMAATYAVGGAGLFVSLYHLGAGDTAAAAAWGSALAVGGSGVLSFVRHSVFHRSDAARMGWDYGRRNDFQIEVGFANLAIGLAGFAAWALGWGTAAEGAVVLVYGLYLLGAAVLHATELRRSAQEGGGRIGPVLAATAFAAALLWVGAAAVGAA